MKFSKTMFVLVVIALTLGLGGCEFLTQWFNPPGVGVSWASGDSIPAGSQTVPASGGTVTANDPGGALSGMVIEVPAGAYPGGKTFTISYKLITGDPGPNINPLTPLITVENGGAFADDIMTVTIPVAIPAGYFAMGFFVDENGKLEGMPLVAETPTSITVATAHFSSFFIATIADSLLTGTIDTGFRPMTDDWQFANRGSYIEPRGHCAGQSLTAMWYYTERTLNGTSTLWNRFDNNGDAPATPDLWQDDSLGYRLASVVQHDIDWKNWLKKTFNVLVAADDPLNWNAFLYAMLVTGEPQYVSIRNSSVGGGHAMIVYKADADTGTLYVADPNYPGNSSRKIQYANGSFTPYNSGANKAEIDAGNGKAYDQIRYFAKTALVSWSQIAARWAEFELATIGDGIFPAYALEVADDSGGSVPLTNGMVVSSDKLGIFAASPDPALSLGVFFYRGEEPLSFDSNGKIDLLEGENRLGIYVLGNLGGGNWKYIDFQWVTVTKGTPTTGYVKIVVQVHGYITAYHPFEIDQDTGQPGVTYYSDSPYEMLGFRSWDSDALTGNKFTASWSGFMEGEQGPYTGSMNVTFNDAMDRVVSFTVTDSQTFDNGEVDRWSASGGDIPIEQVGNGFRWFVIEDTATCLSLDSFTESWRYANGDNQDVTSYTCDGLSYIEIYLYDKKPY